jgi:hypothetical protein
MPVIHRRRLCASRAVMAASTTDTVPPHATKSSLCRSVTGDDPDCGLRPHPRPRHDYHRPRSITAWKEPCSDPDGLDEKEGAARRTSNSGMPGTQSFALRNSCHPQSRIRRGPRADRSHFGGPVAGRSCGI